MDQLEHNLSRIKAILAKPGIKAMDRVILLRAKGRLEGIARYKARLPKRDAALPPK